MDYFKPNAAGQINAVGASTLGTSISTHYPKVGDKVLMIFYPYGGVSIVDPDNLVSVGSQGTLYEVEITAEKKISVNLV